MNDIPEQLTIDPDKLWFNTPDTHTLCRAGGNGPRHPTQLYAIKKYVDPSWIILDYGCGSATTWEALKTEMNWPSNQYLGLDIIPKNIEWCKENFPETNFKLNPSIHKINQADRSFDVVYSRHVVDHMNSFEKAMDEHKRVANKMVIVVLWTGLLDKDEHEIKNIVDQRGLPTEKTYEEEYTNNYSRKLVREYLTNDPEWELVELTEDVGSEVSGHDTVIVLRRKSANEASKRSHIFSI